MDRRRRRQTGPADPAARERALDALALSRRTRISLSQAARATGTTRRTVLRHAGRGFRQEGRRWVPRSFDRIPREMTVLTPNGPELVTVRDSRTASLLAEHANGVRTYLHMGDEARLRGIRRREIRVNGRRVPLVTDADVIDRLAAGSEVHYEVYRR